MPDLKCRLEAFLNEFPMPSIAREVASRSGIQLGRITVGSGLKRGDIHDMLQNYVNETRVAFNLVYEQIRPHQKILEVGAGLCLLSLFLKREGYHIVALEPSMAGHELFDQARKVVLSRFSDILLEVIPCPVQHLDVSEHGSFDLIFSNNVMEHIPDWQIALQAMQRVLSKKGYMLHACPNYSVPFEPHYGVPVFRRVPKLSRRCFLPKNADDSIWNSLNFITCRQIRSYCLKNNLCCTFQKGLLYQAIKRIGDDPVFRQRHQGLVSHLSTFLLRYGLARFLAFIPVSMATPMVVQIEKQEPG